VVETDGDRLYLLHQGALLALAAFPPATTALAERIAIEGTPLGMFVADRRALVVSTVYDGGELGGDPRCDTIGPPFPTSPLIEPWRDFSPTFPCQSSFVKLTLLDLTSTPARTVRELYVEGWYVAARRHGGRVRVVVQRDWGLPAGVPDPWERIWSPAPPSSEAELAARVDAWERTALAAIDASTLADWLPAERERVGGTLVERALTCEHARVPPAGQAGHGTSLVMGLDMSVDDAPVEDTLLLGSASQVYANGETLVLAHPEWQAEPLDGAGSRTALHVFALPADSLATVYRGSGFVPGTLLSQFAVDARGDVLRVATSFASGERQQNVTRVTTLRLENDALATLGATGDLAPGEQFLGARFLGDRAYLVTFLRVDPLFVVDLSDPAHPTVLGEVELPGFSEYLHPLDPQHLLTIGRAADDQGRTLGVALRIFDVGDDAAPRLTHEHLLPNDAWTPAETDHLAFTFDTRLGLLALPVNRYLPSDRATLQLLAIDAIAGIELRGTIDHGGAGIVPCAPPFESEGCATYTAMQRGLFIDDVVYSISTAKVQAHGLDDLATPLASVTLP
jgi:hypothetical protein